MNDSSNQRMNGLKIRASVEYPGLAERRKSLLFARRKLRITLKFGRAITRKDQWVRLKEEDRGNIKLEKVRRDELTDEILLMGESITETYNQRDEGENIISRQ